MIIDFLNSSKSEFIADVCIIGSGAAGFASALTFLKSEINVLVIEGGDSTFKKDAASIHQAKNTGKHHAGIHKARERIIGGTTTKWGGQALPFMKEDFMDRPHIAVSGWPITYEDLKPFYRKAENILGTDPSTKFTYQPWNEWDIKLPGFNKSILNLIVTKWCKIPNFAVQHGEKIKNSSKVNILKNANVIEFLPDELENVKSISIRSITQKEGIVKAKYFISAGGAFESVRLFLNSKKFSPQGIGNKNGLVGLYIQDHVAAIVGQIFPKNRKKFHAIFDTFYKNGYKYLPRLRLSPEFAKNNKLLHASAQIVFDIDSNNILTKVKENLTEIKSKRKTYLSLVLLLLSDFNLYKILKIVFRWKILKRGTSPIAGPIWLEIHSEQEPSLKNKITLNKDKDILNQQRISLDWNISELTNKTIKEMAKYSALELEKSGLANVKLESWVNFSNQNSSRLMTDSYHQAGGLIMGKNEQVGVVDSNCKVFGINNLFVASSAVFPTSSFSNPTMTTIALAIKISEQIINDLKVQNFNKDQFNR